MTDPAIENYVRDTLALLDEERAAEIAENEQLQKTLNPDELQRRGRALLRLTLEQATYGLRERLHLELVPSRGGQLPAHRMQTGDVVQLRNALLSEAPPTGVIARVRRDSIVVALDDDLEQFPEGLIRLDKVANDVTYRRFRNALEQLLSYERGCAKRLRDICFGLREPEAPGERDSRVEDSAFSGAALNASQKEAVTFALASRDLALIHGPPGTGKTTTLVEVIRQAVLRKERVLACAGSNIAVDNLAEKLHGIGVNIVRVGHPARLLPAVLTNSLDAHVERHESTKLIKELRRETEVSLKRMRRARSYHERRDLREELKQLRRGIREFENRTVHEILSSADVILTTNAGAGSTQFQNFEFDLVVIDEGAQALECSCWIPILKGRRLVLAGDHRQLPPTVRSRKAERGGLGVSLFERLATMYDPFRRLLEVQYRMHETIMKWSSDALYDGRIKAHESVATHRLADLPHVRETPDTTTPFLFIDTAGYDAPEIVDDQNVSRWNDGEAELLVKHVRTLLDAGVKPTEIAVITPYNAQVDRLRRKLTDVEPALEVDTVDGFQGREKEAVVLSLVRSNERGEVGFLSDERRLNVAITRARRHVCVIADSATISNHPFLAALVEYMSEHAEYRSAYEVG